jgi:RNA polymerase sigma-70 factor (ECF subfamily)
MDIDWQRLHDDAYRWEVVEGLIRDYETAITQYCVTWLGAGLAEEVAQEVFITAWEQLPKFRPVASLQVWVLGIARNKCKQMFRNRARRRAIDHTFLADIRRHAHAETLPTPERALEVIEQEALRTRLYESLSTLRETERIVLNLRYRQGLSVADIADVLGKSAVAVRKQLDRAKQRLREMMHHVAAGSSHPG